MHLALRRSLLQRQSRLIPDVDLPVATLTLRHDLTLMPRDERHYPRIARLCSTSQGESRLRGLVLQ